MNFNYRPRFRCKMHEWIKVNYVTESDEIGRSRDNAKYVIRKFCSNAKRTGNPWWCPTYRSQHSLAHSRNEKRGTHEFNETECLMAQWGNFVNCINRNTFWDCASKPTQRYLLHSVTECPKDNSLFSPNRFCPHPDSARRIMIKARYIIFYIACK